MRSHHIRLSSPSDCYRQFGPGPKDSRHEPLLEVSLRSITKQSAEEGGKNPDQVYLTIIIYIIKKENTLKCLILTYLEVKRFMYCMFGFKCELTFIVCFRLECSWQLVC